MHDTYFSLCKATQSRGEKKIIVFHYLFHVHTKGPYSARQRSVHCARIYDADAAARWTIPIVSSECLKGSETVCKSVTLIPRISSYTINNQSRASVSVWIQAKKTKKTPTDCRGDKQTANANAIDEKQQMLLPNNWINSFQLFRFIF